MWLIAYQWLRLLHKMKADLISKCISVLCFETIPKDYFLGFINMIPESS
jgi:hypothetical protein